MSNLAYLALTTLKRDKRTIINGIMMLVCFCGLNLILLLGKICQLSAMINPVPYVERLLKVFDLLSIIMFIATVLFLLLVMLITIRDSRSFFRLQKYLGYSPGQLLAISSGQLLLTAIVSFLLSVGLSILIIAGLLRDTISQRIIDFAYIDSAVFSQTFIFNLLLTLAALVLILPLAYWAIKKIK